MFVNDLSVYTDDIQITKNPSWDEIRYAIEKLDGENCSEVTIGVGADREPFMTIVGGDQKFMVSVNINDQIHILSRDAIPSEASSTVILYASGQEIDCPIRFAVDYTFMLIAADTFANSGRLDSSLKWSDSP